MRKIFVDLEMCPIPKKYAAEKEICKLETIEIGAVMLDEDGKETASFKEYVKPAYATEIPGHIEKLTGIRYSIVSEAASFREVLKRFTDWCGAADYTIFSWSDNDLLQILQEGLTGQRRTAVDHHGTPAAHSLQAGAFPLDPRRGIPVHIHQIVLIIQFSQHAGYRLIPLIFVGKFLPVGV